MPQPEQPENSERAYLVKGNNRVLAFVLDQSGINLLDLYIEKLTPEQAKTRSPRFFCPICAEDVLSVGSIDGANSQRSALCSVCSVKFITRDNMGKGIALMMA